MKKASFRDREIVVDILCQAFVDVLIPNSINYVVKNSGNRQKRIKALMEYQFDMSILYGTIFLSENNKGCILYLDNAKFSLKRIILELKLVLTCIGIENTFKVLKREKLLKNFHPKENFVHLWLMAIVPESQGTGIGTQLLKESLEYYKNKLIYVETTTPENRTFYTQNDFVIFHETFKLDYPLYFLTKV
ncbi:GNAT family N-acetyltransferase [Chryseobacterium sp. SIMBA_038]|uniref:GNAT family N-acetyltransferase n=1 Tax=Chryseobacterium sp. SIMBA_038 TaxID=3085780 RepID=UPI00397AE0BA